MAKVLKIGAILVALWVALFYVVYPAFEWYESNKPPFGSSPEDSYISIQGTKPKDAKVKAYGTFYGGGDECKSFSWSASDGKKRSGGKAVLRITHNFSSDENHYELRMPYKNFISSGCDMKLYSIVVDAENAYDTVGFAELRIYPPRMASDEFISTQSVIEANNCRAKYYEKWKDWSDGFACDYFIDEKLEEKIEFSYMKIRLDFTQFSDDTVIQYNIVAGDNYRTEPKEQTKPNDPS
ncbi:hypothetical protein MHN79_13440 [Vibrio sp. Of14-4]|uniref:hypothetical protein n=1 Tax=Vibrio sp. Of14-4 TaxID=2724878 RepID=UPI001EF34DDB|nr:hypothetical protein [Vibrio sp. Of14-4]MCG7490495.1 hypothetical protein [Vibrio sp. Of14-4]